MTDERDEVVNGQPDVDADTSGHLAMAMFAGVIVLILVFIYALASAA